MSAQSDHPAHRNFGAALKHSSPPSPFQLRVKRSSAGLGLFADGPIPEGARIIEYVGDRLNEQQYARSRSAYLFDAGGVWIDGAPRWNLARYINHSCAPNCEAVVRRRRVYIHALHDISPGEELAYDYGADYFNERIRGRCQCIKCRSARNGSRDEPAPES